MRHGTCFRRRLSTHHAGAAPHSAVAELGVVRRLRASSVITNKKSPMSSHPKISRHCPRCNVAIFEPSSNTLTEYRAYHSGTCPRCGSRFTAEAPDEPQQKQQPANDPPQKQPTQPKMPTITRSKEIGPSDANFPCSSSHPYDGSQGPWHSAEIERLINEWLKNNPEAKLLHANLRNDTGNQSLRVYAHITYETTEAGQRQIELRSN